MADTKITGLLSPQVTTNPATDVLPIVNIADTLMASSGSTRKITVNQILGSGGTATLASATITGDLTVDTNTLKVDSGNDRVGIGTATPAAKLIVRDGTNRNLLVASDATQLGSAGIAIGGFTDGAAGYAPLSLIASTMQFGISGSPAMTLNSTGLFLGATAQAFGEKFRVYGAYTVMDDGAFTGFLGKASSLGVSGATTDFAIRSSNALIFLAGGATERMRIDSSGNVGVGVTPSAWWSSTKALQISNSLALAGRTDTAGRNYLASNAYLNSTPAWTYIASGTAAARYDQNDGSHQWHIAPSSGVSGAGTAITFTQVMTLDASGNLLVGTTSAGGIISNATKTVGGIFSTLNGVLAAIATATPTTIFAAPTDSTLIVTAYIQGAAPSDYKVVAIVKASGSALAITTISTATSITITASGTNVQVTQTSGGTQNIYYNVIRLA